jgi:hypothetical protein
VIQRVRLELGRQLHVEAAVGLLVEEGEQQQKGQPVELVEVTRLRIKVRLTEVSSCPLYSLQNRDSVVLC